MKKLYLFTILMIFGVTVNAQFLQYGLFAGGGFGGPKGDGLKIKSGINPEFGLIYRYNMTEKISIRALANFQLHTFILKDGKRFLPLTNKIGPVEDIKFNNHGFSLYADITYIAVEDKLDLSGGIFYGVRLPDFNNPDRKNAFYNGTDTEIFNNETSLYSSDQIKASFIGPQGGVYAAITGGTKKVKCSLRFDLGLKNYYRKYSKKYKIMENYLRIGLMYMIN